MTVMLQIYDKLWTASVLALAALTVPAAAETGGTGGCDLSDGYARDVPAFVAEAEACLAVSVTAPAEATAERIAILTERLRAKAGLEPFGTRQSLDEAARAHALDMAARGYVAHEDPEGRHHLDRLRALDRTLLVGATGANVAAVPKNLDPIAAFNALIADPINLENLTRASFTHAGVGVAEGEDAFYLVQVFAQVDGELETPLPLRLPALASVKADLLNPQFETEAWRLEAADGRPVRRGRGTTILARDGAPGDEGPYFLKIDARLGTSVYALNGPMVSAQAGRDPVTTD